MAIRITDIPISKLVGRQEVRDIVREFMSNYGMYGSNPIQVIEKVVNAILDIAVKEAAAQAQKKGE